MAGMDGLPDSAFTDTLDPISRTPRPRPPSSSGSTLSQQQALKKTPSPTLVAPPGTGSSGSSNSNMGEKSAVADGESSPPTRLPARNRVNSTASSKSPERSPTSLPSLHQKSSSSVSKVVAHSQPPILPHSTPQLLLSTPPPLLSLISHPSFLPLLITLNEAFLLLTWRHPKLGWSGSLGLVIGWWVIVLKGGELVRLGGIQAGLALGLGWWVVWKGRKEREERKRKMRLIGIGQGGGTEGGGEGNVNSSLDLVKTKDQRSSSSSSHDNSSKKKEVGFIHEKPSDLDTSTLDPTTLPSLSSSSRIVTPTSHLQTLQLCQSLSQSLSLYFFSPLPTDALIPPINQWITTVGSTSQQSTSGTKPLTTPTLSAFLKESPFLPLLTLSLPLTFLPSLFISPRLILLIIGTTILTIRSPWIPGILEILSGFTKQLILDKLTGMIDELGLTDLGIEIGQVLEGLEELQERQEEMENNNNEEDEDDGEMFETEFIEEEGKPGSGKIVIKPKVKPPKPEKEKISRRFSEAANHHHQQQQHASSKSSTRKHHHHHHHHHHPFLSLLPPLLQFIFLRLPVLFFNLLSLFIFKLLPPLMNYMITKFPKKLHFFLSPSRRQEEKLRRELDGLRESVLDGRIEVIEEQVDGAVETEGGGGGEKDVKKGVSAAGSGAGSGEKRVVFLFTVFENQRWWVGLDWTMALLPGERDAWSDIHNNAVSPPSSFYLPPSSVMYTPLPSKRDPGLRIKRTSEWRWIDDEWRVKKSTLIPSSSLTSKQTPPSGSISTGGGTAGAPFPSPNKDPSPSEESPPEASGSATASGSGGAPGYDVGTNLTEAGKPTKEPPSLSSSARDSLAEWRAKFRARAGSPTGGAVPPDSNNDGSLSSPKRMSSLASALSSATTAATNAANAATSGSNSTPPVTPTTTSVPSSSSTNETKKESGSTASVVSSATNPLMAGVASAVASSLLQGTLSNPARLQLSRAVGSSVTGGSSSTNSASGSSSGTTGGTNSSGTTNTAGGNSGTGGANAQDPLMILPRPSDQAAEDMVMGGEWDVDSEGWQYGDNHWEKLGSKGGMGRYTRRRAWERRAAVFEKVEIIPGPTAVATTASTIFPTTTTSEPQTMSISSETTPRASRSPSRSETPSAFGTLGLRARRLSSKGTGNHDQNG